MLTLFTRQAGAALRMLLVATVVLGLVYPLAVWGVAHVPGLSSRRVSLIFDADPGRSPDVRIVGYTTP